MSMQRRLRAPETETFVREAKVVFAGHLNGTRPAGPFTLIFHGVVDDLPRRRRPRERRAPGSNSRLR
jgi:hypothetical protein